MRQLLVAAVLVSLVSPAHASFALWCTGPDDTTKVDIPLGGGVGLTPMAATVEFGGQTWTTETSLEDPQAIVTAQSFGIGDVMMFDFADANLERNVIELRLFNVAEGAIGGTLSVVGVGAVAVSCDIG